MAKTSVYPTWCPACRQQHPAGEEISRHPTTGKWKPTRCASRGGSPAAAITSEPAAKPALPRGSNRRAGECLDCGKWLAAGEGRLVSAEALDADQDFRARGGWAVFCLDGAACAAHAKAAREEANLAKAAAAKAAAAAKLVYEADAAAAASKRDALLAGLVRITVAPAPAEANAKPRLLLEMPRRNARDRGWRRYYRVSVRIGQDVLDAIHEDFGTGPGDGDMWQDSYYLPEPLARAVLLAHAAERKITKEAAQEWLAKYAGCYGADLYRAVLGQSLRDESTGGAR